MEESYRRLLDGNKAWLKAQLEEDPNFFHRIAADQRPEYLWIGCSDSRVSADRITGTQPGHIFVHRNLANLVFRHDPSLLAVLQYSIAVLSVKHVIVCGHYGCGGVAAALGQRGSGPADDWLKGLRDVQHRHARELDAISDFRKRCHRLAELNVIEQAYNLCSLPVVQQSWLTRDAPYIHGWIYSIDDGVLRELGVTVRGRGDIPKAFGRL